ncbi:tRNA (cytosine-5-)-methyltransferase NCL1 [Purpureocillium lilacinum]|uniref:Nucleolar protein 2 n=1 Tax=Purpureocillium lilacinum TaxID=33203 RepID=A0A179GQG3_PURLI|nr:S-adenosylmethionine-dependent methyltransferase superfamily domain-containing protein [Purpureocillium lilacinum]PWI73997.1 tRNA (cytosine-5-)-methyltransferase NCL1 [Purpureocillium lilacinum]GJN74374.1 rRNA (cytosine-C5-)-methyltransferase nop2 [Purpureocillium lilacinum]
MGAGRRMARKQGPPEALSEEHFARLKRKAGLPVDTPVEAPGNKRRRTGKNAVAKPAGKKTAAPAAKQTNGKKPAKETQPAKTNGKAKPVVKTIMPGLEDDSDEELDDEFDLDNADLSDDDDEAPATLGDDFLGSDSGSSVFDSDEEGGQGKHVFSEDEDESDAEEKLTAANIAGLTRKLDRQIAEEAAANAAELAESAMKTNIEGDRPHILDDDEEDDIAGKPNAMLAPDLQLLRTRISENIRVLDDFANLSEEGRSRSEYTAQLIKDICSYYGYSEYLAEKLYNLFTPREAFAFFEANETARPIVIRTNTLRTHRRDLAQALINRGVTLEPVGKWSKVGLQIFESNVPLGATPEYLAGHYILQAASSFLPCMALDPQENERVLDMAAAPGGKTTYLAAMMKNTGVIIANDPNKARAKGLIGNIHRLGARNVIVSNYDAREFPKPMGGFDRVLLDAPCSGTGVIAKDPSVKTNKTEMDFMQLPHTQKQLLLAAIDSVNHSSKSGGYVVYSTCSVTVEENEQVVQYALSRRPNVRLVDTGISFGREGFTSFMGKKFDASLKLTRRYYPHTYNVDGFYVAKFHKIGPTPPKTSAARDRAAAAADDDEVIDKTPITDDDSEDGSGAKKKKNDDFGGWDDDEDKEYMEKGRRNAMRRRGLDPRSNKKAAKKQSK